MDQLTQCQCKKSCSSSNNELLEAQSSLWTHIFNYIDSMSLKCAVELGIPDAIHNHGGLPISLSDLLSSLSLSSAKKSHLQRLMRMLTHSGIFITTKGNENEDEYLYSLTPISTLLVTNKNNENLSQSPFIGLIVHPVFVDPFYSLTAWFKGRDDDNRTPFSVEHGCEVWELMGRDPKFNKVFNDGTACDSEFSMSILIESCPQVFQGIKSLVDVAGGTGASAIAISKAFPSVKCSVLDLQHVISSVSDKTHGSAVNFIAGDMFEHIPPADAVFLKWILHDWNDENCVKILKKCKEAIPSREGGGKIIIFDAVIGSDALNQDTTRAQLYVDMLMMVYCGGVERCKSEWIKIFNEAGFSSYKIMKTLGARSVIELYP